MIEIAINNNVLSIFKTNMYQSIKHKVQHFINDESGPTAVEYAVMLALILAVCITAIGALGSASFNMWTGNSGDLDTFLNNN